MLWALAGAGCSTSPCSTSARPALALGYAIGRIGCQLSGDGDYGKAWDGPWAMAYPDGTVPTDDDRSTRRRSTRRSRWASSPTLLWRLRDRFQPGVLFALYLVLAGAERFLVEFIRRNDDVAARAHPGAADQRGDDRRRGGVAGREGMPRHAWPGHAA